MESKRMAEKRLTLTDILAKNAHRDTQKTSIKLSISNSKEWPV